MTAKHKVLIFPAGSEIGLEIFNSLKYSHHVELFGASGKSDHASFVYDADHYVEDVFYVERPDFIDRFNDLLCRLNIKFIYPTHDTIANFLSEHRAQIKAQVITSCAETNRIARSKNLTYALFRNFDFCPQIFSPAHFPLPFPVFLKPDDGQGGKGTFVAEDQDDLTFYLRKNSGLLISELLPSEELSVDCFTDLKGQLLFIGPRTRERIQMGVSFRSATTEVTDEIKYIAESINETVSLNGAWFFQIKKDRVGKFKLMEFAPRQSSTMGLYRHMGVNFALLSLFNALGVPVSILQNDYAVKLDRCLHNRFKANVNYSRVYIDLDETLIIDTHVHEMAMAFVYQCRNRGVKVILITKHRNNLSDTLRSCGISEYVFDEIIHLSDSHEKWKSINPDGAIFIDNYWYDRRDVKENLGIPVFDVDGIECLLN